LVLQELLEREGQRGAEEMDDLSIPDERLKLMFTCCHPALALEAQVTLTLLERPEMEKTLNDYYLFHSARADLLRRAGRLQDARGAYIRAYDLCQNEVERSFLKCRLEEVSQDET
jgi:predicted RNA polymerase sigma factor